MAHVCLVACCVPLLLRLPSESNCKITQRNVSKQAHKTNGAAGLALVLVHKFMGSSAQQQQSIFIRTMRERIDFGVGYFWGATRTRDGCIDTISTRSLCV